MYENAGSFLTRTYWEFASKLRAYQRTSWEFSVTLVAYRKSWEFSVTLVAYRKSREFASKLRAKPENPGRESIGSLREF